ncbi:hypothetical protein B4U80_11703 [Leptotrombidium deliense]|uniref:F-box domain-containing protein n=1 Tax=Leptotrombidium deliense TaxID=299467 RepID=A0A443S3L4_9ACAR|nr:hypothetical protein B4U80_11703 [Leptotrombidium deliense]
MSTSLELLADDVLLNVISFLSYTDATALRGSSRRFRELCDRQLKSRLILVDSSENGFNFTQRAYKRTNFDSNVAINVKYEKLLNLFESTLPNIRTLCLHEVEGIRDDNVHKIADSLRNLNYLWLYRLYRHLTDKGLSQLFLRCKKLQKLALHFLDINGSCFRDIPPVKSLSISSHWNLDADSYIALCSRLANTLESFSFDNLYGTEINKNLLRKIPKLKSVEITIHKSADFVPCLREITTHDQIDELSLNTIAEVSGENLLSIPFFIKITSVSLIFDSRISDEDLMKIIQRFPNVTDLSLNINDEGYYGAMYRGMDVDKVFPEYQKTVDVIRDLKNLENLSLIFDKSSHFKTRVDRYCDTLFSCRLLKRFKLGCLNDCELHAICDYLSTFSFEGCNRKFEVELFTSSKEVKVSDSLRFVRIYKQLDKEEREKSFYSTSNKR